MKNLILFLITALCTVACSTFDDSAILEQLRDQEERIQALETQTAAAFQTILLQAIRQYGQSTEGGNEASGPEKTRKYASKMLSMKIFLAKFVCFIR